MKKLEHTKPKTRSRKTQTFVSFILAKVEDFADFESPMALYEWLVQAWARPLRGDSLAFAYEAAWAVSIDKKVIDL